MRDLEGRVHSIQVSNGGVPKLGRSSARVTFDGLRGDRQSDLRHHGGRDRAVLLYSLELIEALRKEGHPIVPGSIGENLTLTGLDWSRLGPRVRLEIGPVVLEITTAASPCEKIAGSFHDGQFVRVSEKVHPGWSRLCARVLTEGEVTVGCPVVCGGDP